MNLDILYQLYLNSTGVGTDTRKINPGNLFFALKGPNFNANEFAAQALEAGASAVVVDEAWYFREDDERYFICEDALTTLQRLAHHHRLQLKIPVIGLTGSNGKTTSKELLFAVLSRKFNTVATVGNLNNHIGVPLTLLSMGQSTEIAIVEMGANKPGDIKELCEIAEPTHGVITNIGRAHLEGMGGPEGVLRTKTELFQYLQENRGTLFFNSQDPVLSTLAGRFDDSVRYPSQGDFCEITFHGADPFVRFSVEGDSKRVYQSTLIGAYNFGNIALALTIGKFFEVQTDVAIQAVTDYHPDNMRSQLIEKRTNLVILDTYNANPSSMEVAIRTFGQMTGRKYKMVILGDMFELGDHAEEEHRKLGEVLSEYSIDKVCLTGRLIVSALEKVPKALYFPDPFSLRNWLKDSDMENYLILIKGSRGMKLEGLLNFI